MTPFVSIASASKVVMHTVPILEMSELKGPVISVLEAGFTEGQQLVSLSPTIDIRLIIRLLRQWRLGQKERYLLVNLQRK